MENWRLKFLLLLGFAKHNNIYWVGHNLQETWSQKKLITLYIVLRCPLFCRRYLHLLDTNYHLLHNKLQITKLDMPVIIWTCNHNYIAFNKKTLNDASIIILTYIYLWAKACMAKSISTTVHVYIITNS